MGAQLLLRHCGTRAGRSLTRVARNARGCHIDIQHISGADDADVVNGRRARPAHRGEARRSSAPAAAGWAALLADTPPIPATPASQAARQHSRHAEQVAVACWEGGSAGGRCRLMLIVVNCGESAASHAQKRVGTNPLGSAARAGGQALLAFLRPAQHLQPPVFAGRCCRARWQQLQARYAARLFGCSPPGGCRRPVGAPHLAGPGAPWRLPSSPASRLQEA